MSTVYILKMSDGAEILADVVKSTPTEVIVDRPRAINISQDNNGNMTGGLMPYIISSPDKKNIKLNVNTIVTMFPADAELSKSYNSMVSGLLLS